MPVRLAALALLCVACAGPKSFELPRQPIPAARFEPLTSVPAPVPLPQVTPGIRAPWGEPGRFAALVDGKPALVITA